MKTPIKASLASLALVLFWAGAAQAQAQLSLSAEAGGGYDSNIYYEGGPLPDTLETINGGYVGVLPQATLVLGPLSEHYLLLSYQADLRQFIGEDLDIETALKQWIMLGYQPPPVLGVRLLLAGGMTQLYFRDQAKGGWLGAIGMVQLRRTLGSDALDLAPADLALFYVDLANPNEGGTGHTIRVCPQRDIPVFYQDVFMAWGMTP